MAPKNKVKKPNKEEPHESSESESSDDDSSDEVYNGNEVIQVDFEGRSPINSDFHGIRQLLQQLFLKSEINLSELSDIIIDQNFVGSVVIQSFLDDEEDDSDDDDFNLEGTIFGITTVVNVSKSYASGCIEDLRKYLLGKCEQFASAADKSVFQSALNDDDSKTGFLINERFVNIPAQISVPLLESLHKEIERASEKKDKFKFTHHVLLIKFYRKDPKSKGKPIADIFSNDEEEVLCEHATAQFEYSVQAEADTALSGNWMESDTTLIPHRKVILFEANKLPMLINSIKSLINE